MCLTMRKTKIVFVCLGNYCRSPMAEAIFKALAEREGLQDRFDVSSAGTKDWDIGSRPDPRTRKVLSDHGYPLDPEKRARKISQDEIDHADHLIVMSNRIAQELGHRKNVALLLDFTEKSKGMDIPDPYPTNTFPQAFQMILAGVEAFFEHLKTRHSW